MGPESFGAEVVQWSDLVLVTHGAHGVDFEGARGVGGLEGFVDYVGLEEGEGGFAGADVHGGSTRYGVGFCLEGCGGRDIFGRLALDGGGGVEKGTGGG